MFLGCKFFAHGLVWQRGNLKTRRTFWACTFSAHRLARRRANLKTRSIDGIPVNGIELHSSIFEHYAEISHGTVRGVKMTKMETIDVHKTHPYAKTEKNTRHNANTGGHNSKATRMCTHCAEISHGTVRDFKMTKNLKIDVFCFVVSAACSGVQLVQFCCFRTN